MATPDKPTGQGRNSAMDKTDTGSARGDRYANQGGGKLGSGNENSGHPANNVLTRPDSRKTRAETAAARAAAPAGANVKGSGMPVRSGAGQLADDRPGRNEPKGERAGALPAKPRG